MANKYNVRNFVYNGFLCNERPGNTPYTVEFKKWTDDPGIMLCDCSDGKERLIPSCQLIGFKIKDVVEQEIEIDKNTGLAKVLFGQPCES